jgi:hypothetical protein
MTKNQAKTAAPGCELNAASLEHLKSAARRHPKITESLEVAREVGVIAVEAVKQVATGLKQGAQEVTTRHAAPATAKAARRRAPTAPKVG